MNRRIAVTMFAFLLFAGIGVISILAYSRYTIRNLGPVVQLDWLPYQLPPCGTEKLNCAVSLNILAFKPDGSMLTIANLPSTATHVQMFIPEGTYAFWIVASGYGPDGKFVVTLPGTEVVRINSHGSTVIDQPEPGEEHNPGDDLNKL